MRPQRTPATITRGDGFTAIDFPKSRVGPYLAVQYGCQDVRIVHDSDPRRFVWGDHSMERCEAWMLKYQDVPPAEAAERERVEYHARVGGSDDR